MRWDGVAMVGSGRLIGRLARASGGSCDGSSLKLCRQRWATWQYLQWAQLAGVPVQGKLKVVKGAPPAAS